MFILEILQPTFLKQYTNQASYLNEEDKEAVSRDKQFEILAKVELPDDQHIRVTLSQTIKGKNTWIVFKDHVQIVEKIKRQPENNSNIISPGQIRLFNNMLINLENPIYPNSRFSWSEITHGGSRLPPNNKIFQGMIRIAKRADEVRSKLTKEFNQDFKMIVTSGYRPPHINLAIGGASQSRHLFGDALDFISPVANNREIYAKLDPWYPGGLGIYGNNNPCIHIDDRGYKSRWRG